MDDTKTRKTDVMREDRDDPTPFALTHMTDTETIELGGLLTRQVTQTGSFDLRGIQKTSVARLLNAMPIPAMLVDHSYRIVLANPACEKIGFNHEQIQGNSFPARVSGAESFAKAQELMQAGFLGKKTSAGGGSPGEAEAPEVGPNALALGQDRVEQVCNCAR